MHRIHASCMLTGYLFPGQDSNLAIKFQLWLKYGIRDKNSDSSNSQFNFKRFNLLYQW